MLRGSHGYSGDEVRNPFMAQLNHGLDLEFPFGQKLAGSRSLTVEDRRLIFPAKTPVRGAAPLSCLVEGYPTRMDGKRRTPV
jgi:hypothetical protein